MPRSGRGSNSSLTPNCRVSVRDRIRVKVSFLCLCLVVVWIRVVRTLGNPLRMLPETPPGNALRGTPETILRDHPGRPRRDPENDHFEDLVNSVHSMGDSSLKCGVGSIHTHSPISLTLPLSSFGWLRNNSSSHGLSASFRNYIPRRH